VHLHAQSLCQGVSKHAAASPGAGEAWNEWCHPCWVQRYWVLQKRLKSKNIELLWIQRCAYVSTGKGGAWSEWVAPLLEKALQGAPLDMADAWSQALRYGVHGLVTAPTGLRQLFELVTGLATPGELFWVHKWCIIH